VIQKDSSSLETIKRTGMKMCPVTWAAFCLKIAWLLPKCVLKIHLPKKSAKISPYFCYI
jgi:hypothetical protein